MSNPEDTRQSMESYLDQNGSRSPHGDEQQLDHHQDDTDGSQDNASTSRQVLQLSSARFPKWIALSIMSLVSWLALIGGMERRGRMDGPERWAMACTSLAVVTSTLSVLCYTNFFWCGCASSIRAIYMGQLPEVALTILLTIVWAAGLPVIMNPKNSIAVGYTDYLNANLYFASWISFGILLSIALDLRREWYGLDLMEELPTAASLPFLATSSNNNNNSTTHTSSTSSPSTLSRRNKWYALSVTSLIAVVSSVRVYQAFPCSAKVLSQNPTCRQTKYAIAAGVLGTLLAILSLWCTKQTTTTTNRANRTTQNNNNNNNNNTTSSSNLYCCCLSLHCRQRMDWCNSILLLIIWSFGLGYITFAEGPGTNIGNLFFSTWTSFTLTVWLVAESYQDYIATKQQQQQQQQRQQQNTTVEDLQHDPGTELQDMEDTII